jgi:2-polyprenyl-3-methyl-5-hydroxy-6-metoxy-1,4-benzoquinol methylase
MTDQELITQKNEIGNIASSLDYVKSFSFTADSKILDVGCSYGSLAYNLYKAGYKNVHGIDPEKEFVEKGKESYKEIADNLSVFDGAHIPYPDDTFDVVLMFDVIEHIPHIQDFLKEVRRILKPGGSFVFQTPNKYLNIPWEIINNRSFTKWRVYHCSLQTLDSLKRLLQVAGFLNIKIERGNVLTTHNKNKVQTRIGFFAVSLLYVLQILPLAISSNLWGSCKK